MVVMRPDEVRFDGRTLGGVVRVTVDRVAQRVVREWGSDGAHLVFADVPEQLVRARVRQELDQTTLDGPELGELGGFEVKLGTGADEGRVAIRFDAVVESVTHEVSGDRSVRSLTLIAVSDRGEDPVRVVAAS